MCINRNTNDILLNIILIRISVKYDWQILRTLLLLKFIHNYVILHSILNYIFTILNCIFLFIILTKKIKLLLLITTKLKKIYYRKAYRVYFFRTLDIRTATKQTIFEKIQNTELKWKNF